MPTTPAGPFGHVPIAYIVHDLQAMTEDERSAVAGYLLVSDYVNSVLRGSRPADPQAMRWIEGIRSGLRRYSVPKTCRVTREVDLEVLLSATGVPVERLPGSVLHEAGFMSTSMLDKPHRYPRNSPAVLDLVVPAGTTGLAVGELAEYPLERELLVLDSQTFVVVDVRFDQDAQMWWIYAQILPEGGGSR